MLKFVSDRVNALCGVSVTGPTCIFIETFGACTNRCIMCPTATKKNNNGYMKDETFQLIIKKIKEIGFSGELHLYGQSEPFLDKKIIERIHYAHSQLPDVKIIMISNFTHLSEEMMDKILDAPIFNLSCSLYAFTKQQYKEICGRDNFEKTFINQVKFLKKYAKKIPFSYANYIIENSSVSSDIEFISNFIFNIAPLAYVQRGKVYHLHNTKDNKLVRSKKFFSECIYTRLKFTASGEMTSCPVDVCTDFSIGNIHTLKGTIMDIYNNKIATNLRKSVLYNDVGFCQQCEFRRSQTISEYLLGKQLKNQNDKFHHKLSVQRNSKEDIAKKLIEFDKLFKDNEEDKWLDVIEQLREEFYAQKQQ